MKPRRIILVTGMPRSATSAVGAVLASAPYTSSLYEPTNLLSGDTSIRHYYQIPGDNHFSYTDFDALIHRISTLSLTLRPGLWPEDDILRRTLKRITGSQSRLSLLRSKLCFRCSTIVWKDPIAAFLAPLASQRHDIPVIITYRNPCAVAASFKRLAWAFDLQDILARARTAGLVKRSAFEGLDTRSSVVNAAVLWAIIYTHLTACIPQNGIWHFVDTDALVADPHATYRKLFSVLNLPTTGKTTQRIRQMYATRKKLIDDIPRGHAHTRERDLLQINTYWQKTLTRSEMEIVGQIVAPYEGNILARLPGEAQKP
jgi:hypothetical protein